MIRELWEPLAAFLLSLVGAGLALAYARRAGLFDVPNHRSSHFVPTPRGGGIALVGAVLAAGVYDIATTGAGSSAAFLVLMAASLALAFVGWMDDRHSIRVGHRLGVHLACGLAIALLVNQIAPHSGAINLAWLAWWAFWAVASINIVNFMDGVDGMIAAQGLVYGVFLFAISGSSVGGRFGLIFAAASLGFLTWNWAPARMFMGDVGSGPLGLFFVIGGALCLVNVPATLVFLPLFPLFLDALITLLLRFRRGESLASAHRSHLYQRLANGGYGHARVSSIYALAAGLGAAIALAVRNASPQRVTAAIAVYVLFVLLGWKLLHDKFGDAELNPASELPAEIPTPKQSQI